MNGALIVIAVLMLGSGIEIITIIVLTAEQRWKRLKNDKRKIKAGKRFRT